MCYASFLLLNCCCLLYIFFLVRADISAYTYITHVGKSEVSVEARRLAEGEPKLLDVTAGCVVPLSPPPQDQAEGEFEINDDGGNGSGSSASGTGDAGAQDGDHAGNAPPRPVIATHKQKRKVRTGAPTPPLLPKKLRADYGLLNRPTTSGKSMAAVKSLMHPLVCKIRDSFSLSLQAWYLDDGTII